MMAGAKTAWKLRICPFLGSGSVPRAVPSSLSAPSSLAPSHHIEYSKPPWTKPARNLHEAFQRVRVNHSVLELNIAVLLAPPSSIVHAVGLPRKRKTLVKGISTLGKKTPLLGLWYNRTLLGDLSE